MKYRLKDRELQAKLDDLTNGEFSASLKGNIEPTDYYRRFNVDGIGVISVMLNSSCLEERFDYDPRSWNPFPKVTPPEGVLMRVEFIWNDGSPGRCCGKLWNGVWVSSDDLNLEIECVKRFRPWEDEE